jgi:hypothetical protein
MSLINDALKRAKQAQAQNPFGGQPAVPLQPVDDTGRPNYWLRSGAALLVIGTLACSGWFFWKWWGSRGERSPALAANEAKADLAAQSKTPPQPSARKSIIQVSTNIVVRSNAAVTSKPVVLSAPTNASISTSQNTAAAPTPPAEPAPPPSPFADLKLRSIIYREDRPAAVINGDMLYLGDEIRGARVVRIDRHSVTVERNGETNELRLPRL